MIEHINEQDIDGVLFAGDQTKNGYLDQYEYFDRLVDDLEHPFVAIPGNHDLPISWDGPGTLDPTAFERRYTPGEMPFVTRFGDVDVIGVNSHPATDDEPADSFDGAVTERDLDRLDRLLSEASNPLVAVHHNLRGTRDLYEQTKQGVHSPGDVPPFRNADALVDVLDSHDVPLTITGHLHFPAVRDSQSVRELTVPAAGSFPQAYVMLDIDATGTSVYVNSVTDMDGLVEALGHGLDKDRVLLAAAQMAQLPLVDEQP